MKRFFSRRSRSRTPRFEPLESRQLLTAVPLGALPEDTGEFMLGRVAVTPIFFESNGALDQSTENWTALEIEQTLAKIREGVNWWTDALANYSSIHTLEFVIDETFARNPVATKYEPISRPSNDHTFYVSDFLVSEGFARGSLTERMLAFNHAQREKLNTDWAFSIVVADASADSDGRFASTGSFSQAFAFAGGLYMVAPSVRPSATFTHETGHIFWAQDEYEGGGSWHTRRGYYNTQNMNAANNPAPGFVQQPSIMASSQALQQAFLTHTSAASTLAMIGWQDSDGDGIFDVLDVPLEFEGYVAHDAASNQLRIAGVAQAVALTNKNSAGFQSDITLNRVQKIEVRLDGGAWQTLAEPDQQRLDLNTAFNLNGVFSELDLRFTDARTGIFSEIISLDFGGSVHIGSGVQGVVFLDLDDNQLFDSVDAGVNRWQVQLQKLDGSPVLPKESIFAEQLPNDLIAESTFPGIVLSALNPLEVGRVGVEVNEDPTLPRSLWWYSFIEGTSQPIWSGDRVLRAKFDQLQSVVSLDFIGTRGGDVGRLEAFDAQGNLLVRTSTRPLAKGERETLTLALPNASISAVEASGQGLSRVLLDGLVLGVRADGLTDANGVFSFAGVEDGQYQVRVSSPTNAYRSDSPPLTVEVQAGRGTIAPIGFTRFVSPWQNSALPNDVDNNSLIQPIDALLVINALNRSGSGELGSSNSSPPYIDVNGDGFITPLDALLVINELNRLSSGSGQAEQQGFEVYAGTFSADVAEGKDDPPVPSEPVDPSVYLSNKREYCELWDRWVVWGDYDFSEGQDLLNSREPFDYEGFQDDATLVDACILEIFA